MQGVSIVIPTYKRPDFLSRLLKSIDNQTYKNYEVIIVDDNSPNIEEYYKVILDYKNIISDITFITNDTNRGAPYSRNIGIKKSKYELIALVDDDDEWLSKKLEYQVDKFKKKEIGIVYTWTNAVNEHGDIIHQYKSEIVGNAVKDIIRECFIPSPSVMVRKKAIMEAGLFDESFPSCQDWDMWTQILKIGYQCDVVKEVVTIYNKHSRESIGLSAKAKTGYKKYYRKHLLLYFKYYLFSKNYKVLANALLEGYIR